MNDISSLASREAMLEVLRSIDLRAIPTVETFDMGLEIDFITSEGAGSCLGSMTSWPLFRLNKIEQTTWDMIREKLQAKTLRPEDLEGTQLPYLSRFIDDERLSEAFHGLLNLPDISPDKIYCLFDYRFAFGDDPLFFETKEELCKEFKYKYCGNLVAWEDMDDDEIQNWYGRLSDDLDELPFNYLPDEDE